MLVFTTGEREINQVTSGKCAINSCRPGEVKVHSVNSWKGAKKDLPEGSVTCPLKVESA